MKEYQFHQFLSLTGGRLQGKGDSPVRHLITDSRQVISPSDSVFIAIRGPQRDGHQFLEDVYRRGIRMFIISWPGILNDKDDVSYLQVEDPLTAMQAIAGGHRKSFTGEVIGITGSNGKTVIKEWLFQLLSVDRYVIRSPRSYNSQIGVPLSLWLLEEDADMAIIEAGISQPGEMEKLEMIIQPTLGIFTNIGSAHQQHFKDMKEKVKEKLILFHTATRIIYCADHKLIHQAIGKDRILKNKQLFTWSFHNEADLRVNEIQTTEGWTSLSGYFTGEKVSIRIPFTDQASVENAIHAWSAMLLLGYDPAVLSERFEKLAPVAMRLEIKKGTNQCTIINDSYNSDLVSLRIALDLLQQQNQHALKTVILSDILQTGKPDIEIFTEVNQLLEKNRIGKFIGIGPALDRNKSLFSIPGLFFQTTGEFIRNFDSSWFQNQAILLKGSRDFEFERISSLLEEKVHQTVLEIDLNAVVNNLQVFRSMLTPGTRIMVMVKALSYGSGTYEIANVLQHASVDYLAVAFTDEGVSLREAGIHLPIMVMSPDERGIDAMIRYNLEPEIYSMDVLLTLLSHAMALGIRSIPVHIKLDTGMHRLGFMPGETDRLTDVLRTNRQLMIKSVFSHLAASEDPAHDAFTMEQISLFIELCKKLARVIPYPFLRHILNSAGIERFPSYQFEMVRLGIGLYGISSMGNPGLVPVATLRSIVSQLKEVENNKTIGYGRLGLSGKGKRIAIVPIGYADGLDRRLGNGVGWVLIGGQKAPIIGNICMDMCMVDVTGLEVKEGEEVIIFGRGLSVEEIARRLNTIPYEVMTGVSQRVKRIYFQE
jgi:alanine racemase